MTRIQFVSQLALSYPVGQNQALSFSAATVRMHASFYTDVQALAAKQRGQELKVLGNDWEGKLTSSDPTKPCLWIIHERGEPSRKSYLINCPQQTVNGSAQILPADQPYINKLKAIAEESLSL